jgi:hypothetical protein
MKRRNPGLPAVLAEDLLDAAAHLIRGFVRERHSQDLIRRGETAGDDVTDADRDHPGLAGACAGEDEKGTFGVKHRVALFRIQ